MSFPLTSQRLSDTGAALLGGTLRQADVLSGGNLSQILLITLEDGRKAIVKSGPAPRTEAAMLRAIAASGAPAPTVLGVNDIALAIEVLPVDGRLNSAWGSLGSALATLHRTHGDHYGWNEDYAFGAVSISNGWADNWPTFWAEHRLLNHLPHLPANLTQRIEALAADLPNRLPARPTPSLLHGDLWGGNILASQGHISGLIDPACYFGHTEVDIAMLTLFDHPTAAFPETYGPLEAGANLRLPIYQLWPALVHMRLFGSSYRSMVERKLALLDA
jgi:fructosamine-3-kinase